MVGASLGRQDPAPRALGPADLVAGHRTRRPSSVGRGRLPSPRPLGGDKGGKAMRAASHGNTPRRQAPVRPGPRPRPTAGGRAMRTAHKTPRRPRVRPAVERGAAGRSAGRLPHPFRTAGHAATPRGRDGPARKKRFFKKLRAGCLTRHAGPRQGGSVARTQGKLGQPHPSPRLRSAKVGLSPTPNASADAGRGGEGGAP